MSTIKDKINQIISEYQVKNHEQIKAKADNLIQKYSRNIKLFEVLAILFAQNRKIEDAIAIFKKILNKEPKSIDTFINIGLAYSEMNKLDKALKYLEKAKRLNIKQSEVSFNIGLVYEKKENLSNAIINYEQSTKHNPKNINALINLGNLLLQTQNYEKAKKNYEKALKISPDNLDLYHNLGIVFTKLNDVDKSIESYSKAIKLHTKNSLTFYNLGILFFKKLNVEEAIKNYKRAIELNQKNSKFFYNLALTQTDIGNYYDAIKNYKKAINLSKDYVSAKYNLARLNLSIENFKHGWHDFEIRHQQEMVPTRVKKIINLNQWNGSKINNKLFVHGEQGIGDIILHSSIIADLNKIQKKICLTVDNRLVSLFKRSFNKIEVVDYESKLNYKKNDQHIPLASLGSFLRNSISKFPKKPNAYILPDRDKVNQFKKKFSKNKKIKIGLSWNTIGNRNTNRNISLNQMSKLLILKEFEFINIQYGNSAIERKDFKNKFNTEILNFDNIDITNDFESLSAIIESCDLVITISNAAAHLSAAIGKKTWVIVPLYTQWHWFHERNNSLWYPNVKLFRQKKYNDWQDVIDELYKNILNIKNERKEI